MLPVQVFSTTAHRDLTVGRARRVLTIMSDTHAHITELCGRRCETRICRETPLGFVSVATNVESPPFWVLFLNKFSLSSQSHTTEIMHTHTHTCLCTHVYIMYDVFSWTMDKQCEVRTWALDFSLSQRHKVTQRSMYAVGKYWICTLGNR